MEQAVRVLQTACDQERYEASTVFQSKISRRHGETTVGRLLQTLYSSVHFLGRYEVLEVKACSSTKKTMFERFCDSFLSSFEK